MLQYFQVSCIMYVVGGTDVVGGTEHRWRKRIYIFVRNRYVISFLNTLSTPSERACNGEPKRYASTA